MPDNDAHLSEPEGSSVSRQPPRDIYEVPGTPVMPKGRVNGVRSARKQALPETTKPAPQTAPEPVSQVSPEPVLQQAPRPAPQAEPEPEKQSTPEPAPPQAPKAELQASVTPKKGINSAPARLHYELSFQIEKGDWVVRLRDPSAPKLDKDDTWDGPFQVQELPRTNIEHDDSKPNLIKLKLPTGSKAEPWTPFRRLIPVHSVADTPTRGVLHLTKDTSTFIDLGMKFRRKSRKERDLFAVGKLRGKQVEKGVIRYLVHWAEYPDEDDSWEKEEGIPEEFKEQWEKLSGSDNAVAGNEGSTGAGGLKRGSLTLPGDTQRQEGGSARKRRRSAKVAAS